MSFFSKLFMLDNKSLIKWGRVQGVLLLVLAGLSFVGYFAFSYTLNEKVRPRFSQMLTDDREFFAGENSAEDVRERALMSVKDADELTARMFDIVSVFLKFFLVGGVMFVGYGLLSIRAHNLAKILE